MVPHLDCRPGVTHRVGDGLVADQVPVHLAAVGSVLPFMR